MTEPDADIAGVPAVPVLDSDTGRVALTRSQLAALVRHAGHDGAEAAGETTPGTGVGGHDEIVEQLRRAGVVGDGGEVHPLVQPVVGVLTAVRCRGVLRRWRGGARPVVEILVGPAGVVVLPGGAEPDALQEVRWHPRPPAVGRLVAELLDLPTEDGPPLLDATPRLWSELVDLASHPDRGIGLADLRWADRVGAPLASVLVAAWHRDGGIVDVTPMPPGSPAGADGTEGADAPDPAGGRGLVRCTPRHPLEIWTGLARLARRAALATIRGPSAVRPPEAQ